MTSFADVDAALAREYQPDYWSDDMLVIVAELVAGLEADGWAQLEAAWQERPLIWQAQLADTLPEAGQPGAGAVLGGLLRSPELEVAKRAAGALTAVRDWVPDAGDRAALAALRERLEPGWQGLVDELLAREP